VRSGRREDYQEKKVKKDKKAEETIPAWCGGSLHDFFDRKLDLSDAAYVMRFASPENWAQWKAQIEEVRRSIGAWWWWTCPAGHCLKVRGDVDVQLCHQCGVAMVRLSEEKAGEAQAVADEELKKFSEQSLRGALFSRNQERLRQGLAELTPDEFKTEIKRWQP
jgi:hypothetical protein